MNGRKGMGGDSGSGLCGLFGVWGVAIRRDPGLVVVCLSWLDLQGEM